jgi:hypothetical protein
LKTEVKVFVSLLPAGGSIGIEHFDLYICAAEVDDISGHYFYSLGVWPKRSWRPQSKNLSSIILSCERTQEPLKFLLPSSIRVIDCKPILLLRIVPAFPR